MILDGATLMAFGNIRMLPTDQEHPHVHDTLPLHLAA
ncbi:hypothetical protein CMEL01_03070 [Colletotrichum melonis]|uniref:Uncharacterized protein n=1 Tax=Colletotrichum melonis TaxID=1209925 RepID=A0AAI9UKK4_9PEZI|nr:hypothetical protein CMEL01_03070 [Colletotrichum melonis]